MTATRAAFVNTPHPHPKAAIVWEGTGIITVAKASYSSGKRFR